MEDEKQPITEHLEALRWCIIKSLIAIGIGFMLTYAFAQEIFSFLVAPYMAVKPDDSRLIFTSLPEAFVTYLKIAFFSGLVLALPVVFFQLWKFVMPGLYENERRYVIPFVTVATLFFVGGAAFAFYVVFPFAFRFFLDIAGESATAMLTLKEYLNLVIRLLLAFGITFELPVIMYFLAKVGVVNHRMLASQRRYAIVIIFILAAVLTPPDAISQILLAIPLLGLYEVSIWVTRLVERNREKRKAEKTLAETAD